MTNIDTQIIFDKNGNPIPQYLDVADKTGGSAGTMKPITGQNGAQFTQLTGSKVELIAEVSDLEIPTGTKVNIISGFSAREYNSIFVQIRPQGANKYRVFYRLSLGNIPLGYLLDIPLLEVDGTASNMVSEYEAVVSLYGSIYLENNTSTDHIFGDVALYGVKS